jgi:hypothetical protein
MGWASYAESINDIRCDLEHFAGGSSKSAELDPVAARAVLAAAERALRQIEEALEVATDPSLEVAGEVVRLRARAVEQEKQRRVELEQINRLSRDAAARALETIHWRDAYLELSRGSVKARRRRPPCRQR